MLASALDEDAVKQESTGTNELRTIHVLTDSYLHKVQDGKDGARTTSRRKKTTQVRAPKRPLVCLPCKKRFTRRSKLDQHNRLVHNTDVRYSCSECHKTFSRRDHIARHVRNGHCPGQPHESTTGAESSAKNDSSQLLVELSTSHIYIILYLKCV